MMQRLCPECGRDQKQSSRQFISFVNQTLVGSILCYECYENKAGNYLDYLKQNFRRTDAKYPPRVCSSCKADWNLQDIKHYITFYSEQKEILLCGKCFDDLVGYYGR